MRSPKLLAETARRIERAILAARVDTLDGKGPLRAETSPNRRRHEDADLGTRRRNAIVMCVSAFALCWVYDYFRAGLPDWLRLSGGGVPYVLFWISLWFVVFPHRRCVLPISVGVTLATCGLECLQLWQPRWLVEIRNMRLGAALLGSGFSWQDFPPYVLGGGLGYAILLVISPRKSPD